MLIRLDLTGGKPGTSVAPCHQLDLIALHCIVATRESIVPSAWDFEATLTLPNYCLLAHSESFAQTKWPPCY